MRRFPRLDIDEFVRKSLSEKIADILRTDVADPKKYLSELNEDERIDYEERAAIMEYDGGLSRREAELSALEYILDLKENKKIINTNI